MKTKVTAILAIALAVCCFFWARSCKSDAKFKAMELQYNTYRAIAQADNEMTKKHIDELESKQAELQGMIDSQATIIASKESTIASLKKSVVTSNAATEALRTEVQPVLDQNPKVAELVASLDTGIMLRDGVISEQESLIRALKDRITLGDERFDNQVKISQEWKTMYDREHALRLQAEDLFKACAGAKKKDKLWGNIKAVAVGVAAGVIVKVVTK
jgi:hypothetical protein